MPRTRCQVAAQQRKLVPFAAKSISENQSVLETVVPESNDAQHSINAVVIVEATATCTE